LLVFFAAELPSFLSGDEPMHSKIIVATLAMLVAATIVKAAIIVTATNPTDLGQGLIGITLHAHSTDAVNQTINGIDTPSLVPALGGSGLHQVWTPITNAPTPTRGAQTAAAPLWSDTWQAFDSYWLFGSSAGDSLSIGAPLNETNSGASGAVIPSAGFGTPTTGFGSMGTVGGALGAAAFLPASGKQGIDVDFAHLVIKQNEAVSFSGQILTSQGNNRTFTNLVFDYHDIPEPTCLTLFSLATVTSIGFIRRR
jgi:hypothetical protein